MLQLYPPQILAAAQSFNLDDLDFVRTHPEFKATPKMMEMDPSTVGLRCAVVMWPDGTRMLIGYPRNEPGPFEHDIVRGYYLAQKYGRAFFGKALAWKD